MLSEPRRSRVAAVTGSRPAAPGGQCQCRRGPPEPGVLPGSCSRRAPHQLRRRRRHGASKAAGPSCAPGGSRGRREPRNRRLEPTSAETKMPEESANTHPGSSGHKLGCETETPALKNNKIKDFINYTRKWGKLLPPPKPEHFTLFYTCRSEQRLFNSKIL